MVCVLHFLLLVDTGQYLFMNIVSISFRHASRDAEMSDYKYERCKREVHDFRGS